MVGAPIRRARRGSQMTALISRKMTVATPRTANAETTITAVKTHGFFRAWPTGFETDAGCGLEAAALGWPFDR